MKLEIRGMSQHGPDIKEFKLSAPDGDSLPAWNAGAHIEVRLPLSGGISARRYSLIGDLGISPEYRIAVLKEEAGLGGSRYWHDEIKTGSTVEANGPFNSFELDLTLSHYVLFAGGIGITPLISMAYALRKNKKSFELHYLSRSRERFACLEELTALASASLHLHVSGEGNRASLLDILHPYRKGNAIYACGPVGLLQGVEEAALNEGWPRDALHFESFGARAKPGDQPLTVELRQSGIMLQVEPGTPILDALIEAGIFVSYECRHGECGTCHSTVIAGTPIHRDVCLTPEQRAVGLCTCVSWASSNRLVLDL